MNNILLIISREYFTRVKKRSFLLTTILTPIILVGGLVGITYISIQAAKGDGQKVIQVLDESGLFADKFKESSSVTFEYVDGSLEDAKSRFAANADGLLYIPKLTVDEPNGVAFYTDGNPSLPIVGRINNRLEKELEDLKLLRANIDREVLNNLRVDVDIATIDVSGEKEKSSSAGLATGIGYAGAFLIYFFIFAYGAMVMRGVIEEKNTRIVEVIVSTVRPFQLMMGKILGIVAVGITQFLIWILLVSVLYGVVGAALGLSQGGATEQALQIAGQAENAEAVKAVADTAVSRFMDQLFNLNLPLIALTFVILFAGGYLLYSALFAAVGSAVDSDADSQQFMLPVTIPLIISIASISVVIQEPHGSFATWLSMIPLTSPVVMMVRVPFGVPTWQLLLSMALLAGGFIFTTWLAARIYRVGILMHGTKVNWRILAKWARMRN